MSHMLHMAHWRFFHTINNVTITQYQHSVCVHFLYEIYLLHIKMNALENVKYLWFWRNAKYKWTKRGKIEFEKKPYQLSIVMVEM